MSHPSDPIVNRAVRAVGLLKPKFSAIISQPFATELQVVGTGFWLREPRALITCAHVVQSILGAPIELSGLLVVGKTGNYNRAVVHTVDFAHDLALLMLVDQNSAPLSAEKVAPEAADGLLLADEYAPAATPVSYAGFPLGNQLLDQVHSPTFAAGVVGISSRTSGPRKDVQISGPVLPGFSGSPVVLGENGDRVVGVVASGPAAGDAPVNIFMAISWEHVKALAQLGNS